MFTGNKKLLLFLGLVVIQNQTIQSSECLSEGFAPRKTAFQVLQSVPRYVLNTIKSDLSIGSNIVQHDTFGSQLAAGVRFTCYGVASFTLGEMLLGDVRVGPEPKSSIIRSCLVAPIIEEILYTYYAQLLDRNLEPEYLKIKGFIPILASIRFGSGHVQTSFAFNIIRMLNCYARHRYMSKRSISNLAPLYRHIMHNTLCHLGV